VTVAYRIAIAGLGQSAPTIHLPAYRRIPALGIVGGCDPGAQRSQFMFPLFTSIPEMLNATQPHILAVATPPDSHFYIAKLGLESNCHVFCEKPFMNDLSEADAIIALSRERNKQVVVNNQFRYMRIHGAAKEKIGSPDFGKPTVLQHASNFPGDRKDRSGVARPGCPSYGQGIWNARFRSLSFFFGEEPLSVYARMPRFEHRGDLIQLEFSGDRVAHVILDRVSRGRHRYLDIRLDGEFASIETSLGGSLETRVGIRAADRPAFLQSRSSAWRASPTLPGKQYSTLATEPLNVFAGATVKLMRAFLVALDGGQISPSNALDNRHTLALMLAASVPRRISIATAYVSVIFLAAALIIGPLNTLLGVSNPLSSYLRRDIGITAGMFAIAHTVAGLQVHMGGDFVQYFLYRKPTGGVGAIRLDAFGIANRHYRGDHEAEAKNVGYDFSQVKLLLRNATDRNGVKPLFHDQQQIRRDGGCQNEVPKRFTAEPACKNQNCQHLHRAGAKFADAQSEDIPEQTITEKYCGEMQLGSHPPNVIFAQRLRSCLTTTPKLVRPNCVECGEQGTAGIPCAAILNHIAQ
jgi:D-apiose dehydrogenase